MTVSIPKPSNQQVRHYLTLWDSLENYVLQERSLDKLFIEVFPRNTAIEVILIKASALNDFYSTNIFSIFPVAKHILSLDIDAQLTRGDTSLVEEIATIEIAGKRRNLYSFASKYCSHHQPEHYPIYDSYVEKVLMHFRDVDSFQSFKRSDLKNYATFKSVLDDFATFYGIEGFGLKDLDRYLWQLGKEYFPHKY